MIDKFLPVKVLDGSVKAVDSPQVSSQAEQDTYAVVVDSVVIVVAEEGRVGLPRVLALPLVVVDSVVVERRRDVESPGGNAVTGKVAVDNGVTAVVQDSEKAEVAVGIGQSRVDPLGAEDNEAAVVAVAGKEVQVVDNVGPAEDTGHGAYQGEEDYSTVDVPLGVLADLGRHDLVDHQEEFPAKSQEMIPFNFKAVH